jgi:hypothetical protein
MMILQCCRHSAESDLWKLLSARIRGSIAIIACLAVLGSSEALRDTSAALIAIFARRAVAARMPSSSHSLPALRLSHASSICDDQRVRSYSKIIETLPQSVEPAKVSYILT